LVFFVNNITERKRYKLNKNRNWTVLFIGGASGTGKSSLAYGLADFYGINVLEADDIHQALKVITTKDTYPAIHYWSTDVNWMDIGIEGNVNWLIDVSKEMIPALKAIVNRHIEDKVPVIIEGDFINPEFTLSFKNAEVKSIYIHESDRNQILQNFFVREGGDLQYFRADISIAYGNWLKNICKKTGIKFIESRPWDNLLNRVVE
jgi:2-phosphoglycerate kinase